jgi:hypothetical protein
MGGKNGIVSTTLVMYWIHVGEKLERTQVSIAMAMIAGGYPLFNSHSYGMLWNHRPFFDDFQHSHGFPARGSHSDGLKQHPAIAADPWQIPVISHGASRCWSMARHRAR